MLLKVSGEALGEKTAAGDGFGLDFHKINAVCTSIKECVEMGVQVGLVIGGGNFWRGVKNGSGKLQRSHADAMGMLATVINSLALQDALEHRGVPTRVQTAIEMRQIAEPYIRNRATNHLKKGRVVIFGCGTGNPFCSTDSAAALRACEIEAQVIFKATNVDGVYDSDPKTNPNAKKYDTLTHHDVLAQELHVMDSAAASLCMENGIDILVFNLNNPHNIVDAVCGKTIGTLVK